MVDRRLLDSGPVNSESTIQYSYDIEYASCIIYFIFCDEICIMFILKFLSNLNLFFGPVFRTVFSDISVCFVFTYSSGKSNNVIDLLSRTQFDVDFHIL